MKNMLLGGNVAVYMEAEWCFPEDQVFQRT